jgi:transposase
VGATHRRYSADRVETRHDQRVAGQLGCGVESLRTWVKQADVDDGVESGATTAEAQRVKALEQENRELRRANEILKRASALLSNYWRAVPAT